VSHGQTVRRGGAYNRLAEPAWADPLDVSHSQRHGGRWNAPGTFGVLYLNRGVRTARLQVHHRLLGQPYGVEDLDAAEQHDLVDVDVPDIEWLDCVTDDGLRAVGLPVGYPRDRDGAEVAWSACRPVAQAAHDDGQPGLACRSAATGATTDDEELAVFDTHARQVRQSGRTPFADWYWA
jgi:hypothetical protein